MTDTIAPESASFAEPLPVSKVTVQADEFGLAIQNAALFACNDDTLPALTAIHLKAEDSLLRVEATNRYVASMEDLSCVSTTGFDAIISKKDAVRVIKALAAVAKPHARNYDRTGFPSIVVTVSEGAEYATFTLTGIPGPDTSLAVSTVNGYGFPKIERLCPDTDGMFTKTFTSAYLERLCKVQTGSKNTSQTVKLMMPEGDKPAVATFGNPTLRVLIMPIRPE